jgi:hypothetical protein
MIETAGFHEREDSWELACVKPGAMLGANVDDDSAARSEVAAVHHRPTYGAGDIVHARLGAQDMRACPAEAGVETVVAPNEISERREFDELATASIAVVQEPRAAVERRQGGATIRTCERRVAGSGFESEIAAAAGTKARVTRIHSEAGRAAHGGDRGVAVGTVAGALEDARAAGRADESGSDGHHAHDTSR